MIDPTNLPKARGNKELKKHLLGDRLTQRQGIIAKCADCMGYYHDGRLDCKLPDCPLYAWMPYREDKPPIPHKKGGTGTKKPMSHSYPKPKSSSADDPTGIGQGRGGKLGLNPSG